jgi:serine/threonine-protein kinase
VLLVLLISGYLVYVLKLPSPKSVILTIFLVIVSPLLIGYLTVFYVFPASEVVVPDVTWHSSTEAFSILRASGLKPRISNGTFDVEIPTGKVVEQQPKKGKHVKYGRIVNLTVSVGQRKVPVPGLIGRPFSQIGSLLSDAGFRLGTTVEVETDKYQTGIIINQVPSPEVQYETGNRVDLYIANNPKFGVVKMPYLIGKTLKAAQNILEDSRLNVGKMEFQETDIVAPGIVMRQEPAWEEEISVGSSVKITISKAQTSETSKEGH